MGIGGLREERGGWGSTLGPRACVPVGPPNVFQSCLTGAPLRRLRPPLSAPPSRVPAPLRGGGGGAGACPAPRSVGGSGLSDSLCPLQTQPLRCLGESVGWPLPPRGTQQVRNTLPERSLISRKPPHRAPALHLRGISERGLGGGARLRLDHGCRGGGGGGEAVQRPSLTGLWVGGAGQSGGIGQNAPQTWGGRALGRQSGVPAPSDLQILFRADFPSFLLTSSFILNCSAVRLWLLWLRGLERRPVPERLGVRIPVRAHSGVAGFISGPGAYDSRCSTGGSQSTLLSLPVSPEAMGRCPPVRIK